VFVGDTNIWTAIIETIPSSGKVTLTEAFQRTNNEIYAAIATYGKANHNLTQGTALSTDVIGDPANYPSDWLSHLAGGNSVDFNPLLVGQGGENYVGYADSSFHDLILSNKLTNIFGNTYTGDGGSTWSTSTNHNLSTVDNTAQFYYTDPDTRVYVQPYTSQNEPYTQSDPIPVELVQPKVTATNSHSIHKGAMLTKCVTGKVAVGNGVRGFESKTLENAEIGKANIILIIGVDANAPVGTTVYVDENFPNAVSGIGIYMSLSDANIWTPNGNGNYPTTHWEYLGLDYDGILTTPENTPITLDNEDSAGCKVFETLVVDSENNEYCIQVIGEELIWDTDFDTYTDYTNITEATNLDTQFATTPYVHVTDGRFAGYWLMLKDAGSITLENSRWMEIDGYIYLDNAWGVTPYFKRWDGNGRGEDGTFSQLTNGTLTDLNGNTIRTYTGMRRTGLFKGDN